MPFNTSAKLEMFLKQIKESQVSCGISNYMILSPNVIILPWVNQGTQCWEIMYEER